MTGVRSPGGGLLIRFRLMSWGCPHEFDGLCQRVNGAVCEPGMRGCVLDGKVTFPDGRSRWPRWPSPGDDAGREHGGADEGPKPR
jgi:hypothetical protein